MSDLASKHWYVVQTRPHSENRAAAHLQRQGFNIYIPRYLKRRRHARRVDTVAAPLFPGYLFVAIDLAAQRWRPIESTVGVARLVCNGEQPAEVPPGVVASLQSGEDDRGLIQLEQMSSFRSGDKVRVLDGVFAACLGLFQGVTDGQRVAILLDMLGRKVRIVLDANTVEAA